MKNTKLTLLFGLVLTFCASTVRANHLPLLLHPNANELCGPVFVQPFAGLMVTSFAGGIGTTEPFFSNLPDGSLCTTQVVNVLGNFQAFDPLGNPVPSSAFDIVGVEVTDASGTFTPSFGLFDFAGRPSITFNDSVDLDQVTFSASDFTFAFTFRTDPTFNYSYRFKVPNLGVDSVVVYDDVQTGVIPEPSTVVLLAIGFAALMVIAWQRRRLRCTA